jgi:hypothetical protein
VSGHLLGFDIPHFETWIDSPAEVSILIISVFYVVAALFNLFIPDTGVDHHVLKKNPLYLLHDFYRCNSLLWKDKLGQISLATTTLFWGAGATLQFIVLKWAEAALGYTLSQATLIQGVVAVGIALGAAAAAKMVPLRRSPEVLPFGVVMGLIVIVMIFVRSAWVAMPLMVAIGALAGFFVVPMNALLQHRGHILMGAGHSIAVQNFNENLSILVMLAVYALMIRAELSIYSVIVIFGLFVAASMVLVRMRHLHNQRSGDLSHLIGVEKVVPVGSGSPVRDPHRR